MGVNYIDTARGYTVSEEYLGYALDGIRQDFVLATIQEAEQNYEAVCDTKPLSAEEQKRIEAIRENLGTQFCRRCNYCAPCSAGISIYSMFLMQSCHDRYDLQE